MRRAAADELERRLTAKGIEAQRTYDGPRGYVLRVAGQTVATRKRGEELLRKGAKRG
jgi:hypothetical protein